MKASNWKPLGPAQFIIDPQYPTEFTSTDLGIYINLANVPAEMPFEDLIFHVNRAILTETLCYYITESGYPRACGSRCVPSEFARYFCQWLGFAASFDFYDDYKTYLQGSEKHTG